MSLISYAKCKFDIKSLLISDDTTIDEWREIGRGLSFIGGSVQIWIGDWIGFGKKKGFYTDSKVYDELEEITGLDRGTLKNYKSVAERVESSCRRDDLSYSHHEEVAKLNPEKQNYFLGKASEEKWTKRELREEIRKDDILTNEAEMPPGKYRIIYSDPPWQYGNSMPSYFTEQADHYPLMSIDEICEMPVKEITQDNAVLFLWVTSPILEESFKVVNAWGFKYKTSFIWDKIRHNMGHYNSVRHEILLLCTKGSCPLDNVKLFDSVVSIERTEHSKKPQFFREIIDTIYPNGNRIELFARNKNENWEVYGNQLQESK